MVAGLLGWLGTTVSFFLFSGNIRKVEGVFSASANPVPWFLTTKDIPLKGLAEIGLELGMFGVVGVFTGVVFAVVFISADLGSVLVELGEVVELAVVRVELPSQFAGCDR